MLIASLAMAISTPNATATASLHRCDVVPPVLQVTGVNWYKDKAGSEISQDALAQHQAMIRPLRDYVTQLVHSVEIRDFDCANTQLKVWASHRALLIKPKDFAAQRERLRFGTAIYFATLRMIAAGHTPPAEVMAWIKSLNRATMLDFRKRKIADNLYVWSGAAAALAWEITGDEAAKSFSLSVRDTSVSNIQKDGLVQSEIRRKTRSLLYHSYYLAGLLLINEVFSASELDQKMIGKLYERVRQASCDPVSFSNDQPQVPPNSVDIYMISELFSEGEPICTHEAPAPSRDPLRGGDLAAALDAVRMLRFAAEKS